ncbi:MAG: hypothetical protein IKZ12_02085, partial [Alistipes sp.]|nr:hypothetical protein [Alistipes sp.]
MDESNKSIKAQFELQLHEQYAINNNEGVKSFIAFLTAILALFGSFGYIFINTNYRISNGDTLLTYHGYAFEAYIGVALVTVIMLAFLAEIALSLGFSQRHNHIIIQRIREKYYDQDGYREIFKNSYKGNDKTVCNFIPDIYNIFYWMCMVAQLLIFAATIYQHCRMEQTYCAGWVLLVVQF